MKGLILNNIYSVQKSMNSSILLAIVAVIGLLLTKQLMLLKVAIFLPFFLIPVNAFEVLKHDAMSGWNKFERTLPVTQRSIITSKYITFLLLFGLSVIIVFIPFLIAHLFFYSTMNVLFLNFSFRGMGLILCVAAMLFPLTYKLGTEKSDSIMMTSGGISIGLFFFVSVLLQMIIGTVESFDEIFSITFLGIAILFLIVSYMLSNWVCK